MTDERRLPRILPFGDSAVLIELGERIDPATNRRVHRLARAIGTLADGDARFGTPIPSYATVLVPVDPLDPGVVGAISHLRDVVTAAAEDAVAATDEPGKLVEVPTRYGGENGPDLTEIASRHRLREAEVVELHASVEYRVYLLGFAPGFAYLGTVPDAIRTPRRATPRTVVPAGSVAIAGEQTAIYPFETPGGWQLLGRTDVRMWDTNAEPPALLAPGDRVRFIPIA